MSTRLRFTDANFTQEVLNGATPVLVDFWASWCPPCKMVEPIIDELAEEFRGKIKIGKVNVDQNPRLRDMFEIAGVPAFILFEKGKVVRRESGARSKQQLKNIITEVFGESVIKG
jgi:thioredoxin 1